MLGSTLEPNLKFTRRVGVAKSWVPIPGPYSSQVDGGGFLRSLLPLGGDQRGPEADNMESRLDFPYLRVRKKTSSRNIAERNGKLFGYFGR